MNPHSNFENFVNFAKLLNASSEVESAEESSKMPMTADQLREVEELFCRPDRRPEFWGGKDPREKNQDMVVAFETLGKIVDFSNERFGCPNRTAMRATVSGLKLDHFRGEDIKKKDRGHLNGVLLEAFRQSLRGQAAPQPDPAAQSIAERIERFFGIPIDDRPGYFDPRWAKTSLPTRYAELAYFYRTARRFVGLDKLNAAAIVSVAGSRSFFGGGGAILEHIKEELEACAAMDVKIVYVAPDDPDSRANVSLREIEKWKAARNIKNLRTMVVDLAAKKPSSAKQPENPMRFAAEYMGTVWRYTAIIRSDGYGKSVDADLVGIRRSQGPHELHSEFQPTEHERKEFLDWAKVFVL